MIYITTNGLYIIFGVTLFVCVLVYVIFNYYLNRVNESSELIRDISLLNKNYKFQTGINKKFVLIKACTSYAQYKKVDFSKYFMSIIYDKIDFYDNLLYKIESNIMLYKEYNCDFDKLKSVASKSIAYKYKMPLFIYIMIEKILVNKKKAKPRTSTEFVVRSTYVSPKGKNHYQDGQIFDYHNFKDYVNQVHIQIEKKNTKAYQRSIMSDSLRYEILHRDGFKCQLCGASSKDGFTKLQVDHILPISKGGKTEKSNLRTLCDQCNLGKRDKIE